MNFITNELNLNQFTVNSKYVVKQYYDSNDDLLLNDYGVGTYLGIYLNNDKQVELLFTFDNEEVKDVTYHPKYLE